MPKRNYEAGDFLYQMGFAFWLTIFLGTLYLRLQQVFWPNAMEGSAWVLFFMPLIAYSLIYPLGRRKQPLLVVTAIVAVSVLLAKLTGEISSWQQIAPWKPEFVFAIFLVFFAFAGAALLALVMARYLHRKSSIWPLLFLSILVQMLIFSYVDRKVNNLFYLNLISAVFFQVTLRTPGQPGRLRLSRGRRYLWATMVLSTALILGAIVPPFEPVWFQNPSVKGDIINKFQSLREGEQVQLRASVFSWDVVHLGEPWQPSDEPLFYVQSSRPTYWRSQVFDTYSGGGGSEEYRWYNTQWNAILVENTPWPLEPGLVQPSSTMTGQVLTLPSLAFGVGIPLPNYPTKVADMTKGQPTFHYYPELQTLLTNGVLPSGTGYTVEAALPGYTKEDLRKVKSLPSSAPGFELKGDTWYYNELAARITADAKNPYDKMEALTNYLRTNGTYTLNPPPRQSKDVVAEFLRGTRQGYCVHFSSSLVVLAQSLGYPARWVVGFDEGERLPDDARNPFPDQPRDSVRVLTEANAHAWAEVYFPGYGWVPFEATPGFTNPMEPPEKKQVQLPGAALPGVSDQDQDKEKTKPEKAEEEAGTSAAEKSKFAITFMALGAVAVVLSVIYFVWRRHLARLSEREKMQRLYRQWVRRLARKGIRRQQNETPGDFAKRTLILGTEWESTWVEFTRLAEEAYYASDVAEGQLQRMQALSRQLGFMQNKKTI